ncbi:NUDIX domain-containing protein [Aliikangiella coralliicola]|uniref:8-oxo-dGTP diphosphatase n=1 Tax=Aliikangiella coralliicola TaxID=2592383 RepID=A0A545TW91_9GAMM|nr:NUDIX domain-containing protein [Aliikangiella coralliicola]TQV81431.1 NUDIX domain-containing protein [Aliikangiella coralliicola]
MSERLQIVSGIIQREGRVLLCLRKNTKHYPDYWALPVGHVEPGENDIDALRRELFEEVGIQVLDGEFLTTLYDNEQNVQHAVFRVTDWRGEVSNREPHLCAQVRWVKLHQLPQPLTPSTIAILQSL